MRSWRGARFGRFSESRRRPRTPPPDAVPRIRRSFDTHARRCRAPVWRTPKSFPSRYGTLPGRRPTAPELCPSPFRSAVCLISSRRAWRCTIKHPPKTAAPASAVSELQMSSLGFNKATRLGVYYARGETRGVLRFVIRVSGFPESHRGDDAPTRFRFAFPAGLFHTHGGPDIW